MQHNQTTHEILRNPGYRFYSSSEWRQLQRATSPLLPLLPGLFPFLSLPRELRDTIYRELLVTTIPLQLVHDRPSWPDINEPGASIHPAILQTSQKISREGLEILYGENTFYIHLDKSLERYQMDMRRHDPMFSLPPPPMTCMPRIRRIVMHAGSQDRTRSQYELYRQLNKVGIRMETLRLFAIQFSDDYILQKNKRVNVSWLEPRHGTELRKRYIWFPEGTLSDEGWLVMKQDVLGDASMERIPGLGVY
jgi:hypothetical protein